MNVVAVDAGGTKARFNLYSQTGELLARKTLPTAHPAQVGLDGMAARLKQGTDTVLEQAGVDANAAVLSFGLAGYGPGREAPIDKAVAETFPNTPVHITSDAEIARLGALEGQDGILLIAGTGSIAMSSFDGQCNRAGGWGRTFGDEGSGFWIGQRALQLASKQADGREPRTNLLDSICKFLGCSDAYGMISAIQDADDERSAIASLVPTVGALAETGDPAALTIFQNAARELASLVNALVGDRDHVLCSWAGGVFSRGNVLIEPLKAHLDPRVEFITPKHEPIWGAFIAARNHLL